MVSRKASGIASIALGAALLAGIVITLVRPRTEPLKQNAQSGKNNSLLILFDRLFTAITSLSFIFLALIAVIRPQFIDMVFGKSDLLVSNLGDQQSNLLSMAEGAMAAVWLTSGAIALLGLAIAVGWIRAQSFWRLIGVVVVLLIANLLMTFTPLDQWKLKVQLHKKMIFAFPALLVVFWYMLVYWRIRLRDTMEWHFGGMCVLFNVLATIGLSALVFVPTNFLQSGRQMQRVVVCVDIKSGNVLWERPVFTAPTERKHSENTYATPTPTTDGKYIIVNFGLGIACLDFDGQVLWRRLNEAYFENSRYGAVSSPVLTDDMAIIVQVREWGSKEPTWIGALEKQSGTVCWQIRPEDIYDCYATPLLYRDSAGTQLIIASWGNMASFDAESGECLWTHKIPTEQLTASMARTERFICVGGGTHGPKAIIMMRLHGQAKETEVDVLWQSDRAAPGTCSPVMYDNRLYVLTDIGQMACYDVLSGELLWNRRLRGRFLASLVAGDGKVYASNTKGVTTVLAAGSEFKVLAENDLRGRCYASPALANGCIFIRIADHLYCIEKKHQP
jgi:outer membrane protein assembly factor BamB